MKKIIFCLTILVFNCAPSEIKPVVDNIGYSWKTTSPLVSIIKSINFKKNDLSKKELKSEKIEKQAIILSTDGLKFNVIYQLSKNKELVFNFLKEETSIIPVSGQEIKLSETNKKLVQELLIKERWKVEFAASKMIWINNTSKIEFEKE